jgi:hypothetical protein
MTRVISAIILSAAIATWIVLCITAPWALSDQNRFLNDFVSDQLLGFMGVLVTISLASASNLHLELNKFEEKMGERIFVKARERIGQAASLLIGVLGFSIVLAVLKPVSQESAAFQSVFNGAALITLLVSILTLSDLTRTVFKLGPRLREGADS